MRFRLSLGVVALAALAVSFAQAQQQPEPRSPEETARRARVVVRVGDVRLTVGDVEDQVAQQSPFMRRRYSDPAELRRFVEELLRFELLSREAERQGLGNDPEVREATAQAAVQQLIRVRFDERITPESIPEDEVQAWYEAHGDEFHRPELRRASHVIVATREQAVALHERLASADARTFRQIAQQESLDAETRARGGDLRYFDAQGHATNSTEVEVHRAIVAAAFALREVGEVSAPVEVDGQWSVVKLTGLRPEERRTIEQAGSSIRLRLWRERRQRELDAYVEELHARAGVEVSYDRMRPIRIETPERVSEDPPPEEADGETSGEASEVEPTVP